MIRSTRPDTLSFCGIEFWNGPLPIFLDRLKAMGGYVIVPSAPSFGALRTEGDHYRKAMMRADHAVVDSGLLAATLMLFQRRRVSRISGLRLMQHLLLYRPADWFSNAKVLWVSPNRTESNRIRCFLETNGLPRSNSTFYEAPFYQDPDDFADQDLAMTIETYNPEIIIICIGGLKQERLAYTLREEFGVRTPTLCTGAAIAFLTGGQARIPTFIDRCCLGWLLRIAQDPKEFIPRYFAAAWSFPLFVLAYYMGRKTTAAE